MSPKRGSKRYYKPPSALDKIRHKLADGTPTHSLLRYMHGRSKIPKDVRIIAEAAEKLHDVRLLLAEVHRSGGIDEVDKVTGSKSAGLRQLADGEAATMIKTFMTAARKALLLKTMKEPSEE